MTRAIVAAAVVCGLVMIPLSAQTKKAAPKGTTYDVTVNADGAARTGTMRLAVATGKVTGEMHITHPSEITGKAAGVSKGGQMHLDFPYRMVEPACDGRIVMDIKMPAKPAAAAATGTVSITGCGRSDENKLSGTIELKPRKSSTQPGLR
jgi:hypothetical protein